MYGQTERIPQKNVKVAKGIPTKLDVDKLIQRFGIPEENATFTWEEIAETIGQEKGTYRFKTVVTAWRRQLEQDHNVLLFAPGQNVGLTVADANTRIDLASRQISLREGNKALWVERVYRTAADALDGARAETQNRILTAYSSLLRLTAATAPKKLPLPA